jgi:hypothetical protein
MRVSAQPFFHSQAPPFSLYVCVFYSVFLAQPAQPGATKPLQRRALKYLKKKLLGFLFGFGWGHPLLPLFYTKARERERVGGGKKKNRSCFSNAATKN